MVTRTVPEPPVAGGCDGLFSDAEVARTTGDARAGESDELWQVAIETIGGISCGFRSDSMAGEVVMLPADRARALAQDIGATACDQNYGDVVCATSEVAGQTWVLVTMLYLGDEVPEEVPESQTAVLRALAATVQDSAPAGVDTAEVVLDCRALAERVAVTDILGDGEIYPTRIEDGGEPIERRIADQTAASVRCDWSELDDFRELGVVVIPGGAWAWDARVAAMAGSREVVVAGAAARLWPKPSGETGVLIEDDGDLVWVWGREVSEPNLLSAAGAFVDG